VDLAWEAPALDAEGPQRLRVNVFRQAHGLALALRPVNRHAPTLAELNLPDSVGALGNLTGGMVLVVGTTGAGKSTTLAAIVELVNRTRARHVITLEDPVEFVVPAPALPDSSARGRHPRGKLRRRAARSLARVS